jgi:hypothetical protein
MTAYVISLSKQSYYEARDAIPAASRFTNVEQWGFNHFWLYDPTGRVLIFTSDPIEKLQSMKLEGI